MWRRSAKPAVTMKPTRAPFRSSSAFVATVVPIRIQSMSPVTAWLHKGSTLYTLVGIGCWIDKAVDPVLLTSAESLWLMVQEASTSEASPCFSTPSPQILSALCFQLPYSRKY